MDLDRAKERLKKYKEESQNVRMPTFLGISIDQFDKEDLESMVIWLTDKLNESFILSNKYKSIMD
jgi:hypothetical protein